MNFKTMFQGAQPVTPAGDETTRYFEIYRESSAHGFQIGQALKVLNYSEELPESLRWLPHHARPCDAPKISGDVAEINVAGAIADERHLAKVIAEAGRPVPDRQLRLADLWEKLPWTKDAGKLELAVTQHGFPRAEKYNTTGNMFSREVSYEARSENAVDAWLTKKREESAQLRELLDV